MTGTLHIASIHDGLEGSNLMAGGFGDENSPNLAPTNRVTTLWDTTWT